MKRILTILLAIALVGGAMPGAVWAEETPINLNQEGLSNYISNSPEGTLKLNNGSYKLTSDITISNTLEINDTVTLDLNGYVLKYENADKKGSVIRIGGDGNLTLQDSKPDASHYFDKSKDVWTLATKNTTEENKVEVKGGVITGGTGYDSCDEGGGLWIGGNGSLYLLGGSIVGCTATNRGGGVYMEGKDFTLNGGKIIGCTAGNGGGVYFKNNSFDIARGEISNCHATTNGGGIYLSNDTGKNESKMINMSNSSISDCSANSGGGIYIEAYTFKMPNSSITNCKASSYGGAICCEMAVGDDEYNKTCTVEIAENATISNCSAYGIDFGHGIYAYHDYGIVKIRGGKCNGVCVGGSGFEMSGGDVGELFIVTTSNPPTQKITGGTVSYGDIRNETVEISDGTFNNVGTFGVISGGTFNGKVTNYGTISGGTFNGEVENKSTGPYWIGTIYTGKITLGSAATITTADGCNEVKYCVDGSEYARQAVKSGDKTSALTIKPEKTGNTFEGWYKDGKAFDFDNTAVTEDIILHAKWKDCVHIYESNTCIICGYKKVTYHSSTQRPTVITPEHGKITLSYNGRTATITPDEGYEITSVKVNDIEKGAVTTVTGLRTGDRIEATFEKTEATLIAEIKEALASVSLVARSSKTSKSNIKVVLNLSDEEKVIIANFKEQGYTVKYRFYRSTKKSSGYAARIEKDKDTFINTVGSKGTRYYYKVRIMVYDESGNIVAKTALSDCKYASRVWSK